MSPSSKFSMRRGRHRKPRICHPPPPPPPLIPILPPVTCPPDSVTGYIDAKWRGMMGPSSYYSAYSAPKSGTGPQWGYTENTLPVPGHIIMIVLDHTTDTLTIQVDVWDAMWEWASCTSNPIPFEWCKHQLITCAAWWVINPASLVATVTVEW